MSVKPIKPHIVFRRPGAGYWPYVYFAGVVESETLKRVTLSSGPARHLEPSAVMARFATAAEADELVRAINAIRREASGRVDAIVDAAKGEISAAIAGDAITGAYYSTRVNTARAEAVRRVADELVEEGKAYGFAAVLAAAKLKLDELAKKPIFAPYNVNSENNAGRVANEVLRRRNAA